MKVITHIQPWATLIALGEKIIVTRSWSSKLAVCSWCEREKSNEKAYYY